MPTGLASHLATIKMIIMGPVLTPGNHKQYCNKVRLLGLEGDLTSALILSISSDLRTKGSATPTGPWEPPGPLSNPGRRGV